MDTETNIILGSAKLEPKLENDEEEDTDEEAALCEILNPPSVVAESAEAEMDCAVGEVSQTAPDIDTNMNNTDTLDPSSTSTNQPVKRTRSNILTMQRKLELLADFDRSIGTRSSLAKKYGVPRSTLSTIIKTRHKIEAASQILLFQPGRKKMRESNFSEVDRQLFTWVRHAQANNSHVVNGPVLAEESTRIADALGVYDFRATPGWVERFKKRHGILYTKSRPKVTKSSPASSSTSNQNSENLSSTSNTNSKNGDGSNSNMNTSNGLENLEVLISSVFNPPPVNKEAAGEWTKDSLPYILDEYHPADIFCADEAILFYKWLPDKDKSEKRSKLSSRDKVSILLSVNMTGMEKLPLLVLGQQKITNSKFNSQNLPIDYVVDKNICLSPTIFASWLQQMDETFSDLNRKIALVLNSSQIYSSSSTSFKLRSIKVVYLPEDTTSLLNPCKQGIIHSFKTHYRTRILQKYILHARNEIKKGNLMCSDNFFLPVTSALYCMRSSWDEVEKDTIVNAFRHAGFHAKLNHPVIEDSAHTHINHLLSRLSQLVPVQTNAASFVDIDKDLIKKSDLVTSVAEEDIPTNSKKRPMVSAAEATSALETLKQFSQERSLGNEFIQAISTLEFKIDSAALEDLKMEQADANCDDSGSDTEVE